MTTGLFLFVVIFSVLFVGGSVVALYFTFFRSNDE